MPTFRVTKADDRIVLTGFVGEAADLSGLVDGLQSTVTVDMRGVTGFNSTGVQRFLEFVDSWESRPVELVACSEAATTAFVMLPMLLGLEDNIAKITSLEVPYECADCGRRHSELTAANELVRRDGDLVFPRALCGACRTPMEPTPAAAQLVELVELGALPARADMPS